MAATHEQTEVILVGSGAPNRGMGWYHAVQLLEKRCPSASLGFIIEPWFLGRGADAPGGSEFTKWKQDVEADYKTRFCASFADLPEPVQRRTALIAGRTADNPSLFSQAIAHGCNMIYLEKPGASSVVELDRMKAEAAAAGVEVFMGYNKNICKYVAKTRAFATSLPNSHTTFVSNNDYEPSLESLGECFERNAEGMLKNMAIHELALLVSFYGVSVDTIASVTVDQKFSSLQTLAGPSGKLWTDFDKIKFTIVTKAGAEVSVQADRCGGTDSYGLVTDESGKEVFRYSMPDREDLKAVENRKAQYPLAMSYFLSQDLDYVTLKELVAKRCVDGSPAQGVATLDIAVETLKVAEYLTPILRDQLTASKARL